MPTHADKLFINIAQLVTPLRLGMHRGGEMAQVRVIPDAALAVRSGEVVWVGTRQDWRGQVSEVIDLDGRAVVPSLIDPHTHAIWAGERLDDFEARAQGASYEEILARGGGIYHTIRCTAQASVEELVALACPRILHLMRSGATTIEVKSGYGLTPEAELKILEAIAQLPAAIARQGGVPTDIVPTLLIHVPPREGREDYLRAVCHALIPEVARRRLARAVDIFIEREAFSVQEAEQVLRAAKAHGLDIKVHADQFHAIGGVELAVRLGARSVDHLEASGEVQIRMLASSSTVATILPGVSLHLGLPPAPARALIEAGAAVALGTDLNPGSSPLFSTQLAMALAVRLNRLTPAEVLVASTANAAAALGLIDRGALVPGARADFLVLSSPDWRDLPYTLGGQIVDAVYLSGERAV
ncbi:Imidazolonepropionase [bacterium HR15]|nr:Imidazolonepropionase [bacterium HR15]